MSYLVQIFCKTAYTLGGLTIIKEEQTRIKGCAGTFEKEKGNMFLFFNFEFQQEDRKDRLAQYLLNRSISK